jgi:hypothetical protein
MKYGRRSRWLSRGAMFLFASTSAIAVGDVAARIAAPRAGAVQPVNDVLFLAPDPRVGWTLAKDFEFVWSGRNPYCVEFNVRVTTNDLGFRDRQWRTDKPPATTRIAVMGDSFVEAIQVPAEQTATRLLENRLAERFPGQSFETMNFGVSNYSVGQYLLVYDAYVRQFDPDYVVVLAGYLNFNRTTQRGLSSALQRFYSLNIRPSFEIDHGGRLVAIPAREHQAYAAHVRHLVETTYGPDRSQELRPFPSPLHLTTWLFRTGIATASRLQHWRPSWGDARYDDVALNYRIVQALQEKVAADGAVLVFADAFEYLERYGMPRGSGRLAHENASFVRSLGTRFVNVSPALSEAAPESRFACDMHFSASENRQLAAALTEWFATELKDAF